MDDGDATARPGPTTQTRIAAYDAGAARARFDTLATEEPLEIRLRAGGSTRTLAITMRTPGHDFELVAGFLHGEGLLRSRDELRGMSYCVDRDLDAAQRYNIVNVDLAGGTLPELRGLERHFATSSACGICGAASLEALRNRGCAPIADDLRVAPALIEALPERLRAGQGVFARTGGLHAAGRFDARGEPIAIREDVGRHNALDKLVGAALLADALPLAGNVLVVSGRASYELVQKALVARAPMLCAVSAPSSLAVDLARAFALTLCGFVRDRRFNVYAAPERIVASGA